MITQSITDTLYTTISCVRQLCSEMVTWGLYSNVNFDLLLSYVLTWYTLIIGEHAKAQCKSIYKFLVMHEHVALIFIDIRMSNISCDDIHKCTIWVWISSKGLILVSSKGKQTLFARLVHYYTKPGAYPGFWKGGDKLKIGAPSPIGAPPHPTKTLQIRSFSPTFSPFWRHQP